MGVLVRQQWVKNPSDLPPSAAASPRMATMRWSRCKSDLPTVTSASASKMRIDYQRVVEQSQNAAKLEGES
jgi:hypothetical protein